MSVKQISVFVENKPGAMNAMTAVLADHGIDMRALSLAETEDFGIVRIIVNDTFNASTVLKDAGYVHSVTTVIAVQIPDTPGGLNKVLQVLAEAGANIEYMYAFLGSQANGHAYMIFRVKDTHAASVALRAKGFVSVKQDEISKI